MHVKNFHVQICICSIRSLFVQLGAFLLLTQITAYFRDGIGAMAKDVHFAALKRCFQNLREVETVYTD
jgi:hypothetical protein